MALPREGFFESVFLIAHRRSSAESHSPPEPVGGWFCDAISPFSLSLFDCVFEFSAGWAEGSEMDRVVVIDGESLEFSESG